MEYKTKRKAEFCSIDIKEKMSFSERFDLKFQKHYKRFLIYVTVYNYQSMKSRNMVLMKVFDICVLKKILPIYIYIYI